MISGVHGVKAPQVKYPTKPPVQHQKPATPSLGDMYSQVAQTNMHKKPRLH